MNASPVGCSPTQASCVRGAKTAAGPPAAALPGPGMAITKAVVAVASARAAELGPGNIPEAAAGPPAAAVLGLGNSKAAAGLPAAAVLGPLLGPGNNSKAAAGLPAAAVLGPSSGAKAVSGA